MHCCPNCFSNDHLKSYIRTTGVLSGTCSYCDMKSCHLVTPDILFDLFQPITELYKTSTYGIYLNELIQKDWNLFSLNNDKQMLLLQHILEDDDVKDSCYTPIYVTDTNNIKQWEDFREELKHQNRFFPTQVPDKKHLEKLFKYIGMPDSECPKNFFRARIILEGSSYSSIEMTKPPAKKVSNGRANPIGISYLYVASDCITAISEVRPHKGERVTVAEFIVKNELTLADLQNPKERINPFILDEDDDLILIYQNMSYLILLGEELSKPIIPREANLEYLPSQYLCELIKQMGYEGIVYKSSISSGVNFVIFDDRNLKIGKKDDYEIISMNIESKKITKA